VNRKTVELTAPFSEPRYTGQIEEPELGLYFYNTRWYDPALGCFTQTDRLIPQPGSPLGWDTCPSTGFEPTKTKNRPYGRF
jgi:RHS repeat-associated protein